MFNAQSYHLIRSWLAIISNTLFKIYILLWKVHFILTILQQILFSEQGNFGGGGQHIFCLYYKQAKLEICTFT